MKILCFSTKKVTSRLSSHSLILLNPFHTHLAYSVSLSPASLPRAKANIISGRLRTKKISVSVKESKSKAESYFCPPLNKGLLQRRHCTHGDS